MELPNDQSRRSQKVGDITGQFARVAWGLKTAGEIVKVRECFCAENTVVEMPIHNHSLTEPAANQIANDVTPMQSTCANGVCSLTWKPKRPAA